MNDITTARMKKYLPSLLAVLAGALNTLAYAPFGWWIFAIASPAALYLLLRGVDTKRGGFSRGFFYGFGYWLSGVCWVFVSIHVYGATPTGMSVALTIAFAAMLSLLFFAWWTAWYARLSRGVLRPLLFVAFWVLGEWVRSWLFTGFPWLDQGYAFIDTWLAGYAPIGGVLLISAVAVGIAVLGVDIARGTKRARLIASVLVLALIGGGALLLRVDWTQPAGRVHTVSLMQGNIPQDMKWLLDMQKPTITIYTTLTQSEWGRDLLVWPEAAIPMFMVEAKPLLEQIDKRAQESGSAFITGVPSFSGPIENPAFHNSVVALGVRTQDGKQLDVEMTSPFTIYHKVHLVPFGEVVPFASLLRAIAPFFALDGIPLEGFTPGFPMQEPLPAKEMRLATFLCYEIVYPDYVRRQARHADVLLTVSNDAWFGHSHAPAQHFEIARMRALETGRWLIRDTNTGVTGIVDPKGKVISIMPAFTRAVLRGSVTPMKGETPFMAWGEWPLLLLGFFIVGIRIRQLRS